MLNRIQRRMTYLPMQGVPPVSSTLPGAEEVTVETSDGLPLAAWWLRSGESDAPAVSVLHGNGGNRAGRAPLAEALAGRGYHVLLTDYRGYGGNPGEPHEDGLYEDGRAARDWLECRDEVTGVVLFGESLGAAVAIKEATRREPAALVLRSPFASLPAIASHHWPMLPAALIPEQYPSDELIGSIAAPVLVIAGDADSIVPYQQSVALHDAATDPKRLVTIEGGDHNDLAMLAGRQLLDAVDAFLSEHLP